MTTVFCVALSFFGCVIKKTPATGTGAASPLITGVLPNELVGRWRTDCGASASSQLTATINSDGTVAIFQAIGSGSGVCAGDLEAHINAVYSLPGGAGAAAGSTKLNYTYLSFTETPLTVADPNRHQVLDTSAYTKQ